MAGKTTWASGKRRRAFAILIVSILACWLAPPVRGDVMLVPRGSSWKFLANGSDQGTAWRAAGFNDAAWATGIGEFGYGDGGEATTVSYGGNLRARYVTTYFRTTFTIADPSAFSFLKVRLQRDDGAILYINGTEVRRDNLPVGVITYRSLATRNVNHPDEATFFQTTLPTNSLLAGTNTLAVEVHQWRRNSPDLSFDFELVGVSPASAGAITRGPYLQMGTPTSVVVRWRTNTASDSRVTYESAPGNPSTSVSNATVTTEHEVPLTGLKPNTQYYYSVGSTTATLAGGADCTFFTAPPVGTQQPVHMWVLGDPGTGNSSQLSVRNAYTNYNGTRYTDLWLMLGDNAYNSGLDTEYTVNLFNIYPTTLRQSVLWPAIGNHDTAGSATPSLTIPYFQSFTLPSNGQAGGIASGTEQYYSFDYANIHFICLDSMTSNRSSTGAMANWLRSDLAATTQQWIIAFWHHPVYSKGSHDSDVDIESKEMRANFLPILEAGGVDLVLAGHSHNYERTYLLDGHYGLSNTFTNAMKVNAGCGRDANAYQKSNGAVAHQGAVYVTCGTSGQVSSGPINHPAMFISMTNLGSMVLDVNGPRLDAKYLRETGGIDDYFSIVKRTPPSVPTGLSAAAGDGAVTLSWSASDGAATYSLKRSSVAGGPYSLVAAGLTQIRYTDAGVTNGQPYFYAVSATNTSGESANSSAITATPAPLPLPAAPANLSITSTTTDSISLAWTDNSTNESGFRIERSADGSTFVEIGTIGTNVTSFTSAGLRPARGYFFRVRAYHSGGVSTYSSILSASTAAP